MNFWIISANFFQKDQNLGGVVFLRIINIYIQSVVKKYLRFERYVETPRTCHFVNFAAPFPSLENRAKTFAEFFAANSAGILNFRQKVCNTLVLRQLSKWFDFLGTLGAAQHRRICAPKKFRPQSKFFSSADEVLFHRPSEASRLPSRPPKTAADAPKNCVNC